MMFPFRHISLGLTPYEQVWELQKKYFALHIEALSNEKDSENVLILCSHQPVYTLGKNGNAQHIKQVGFAPVFEVERGGDVTFHGPGQLVVYPVFRLDYFGLGVAAYIQKLETVVSETLKEYGLSASPKAGAQGVWIEVDNPLRCRKIAAVGVKVSRGVTMHGIAVNLNTDLLWFSHIVPCGLSQFGVTSLAEECRKQIDEEEFATRFLHYFSLHFSFKSLTL
jgi:lipoyl(octanoyl) transferase